MVNLQYFFCCIEIRTAVDRLSTKKGVSCFASNFETGHLCPRPVTTDFLSLAIGILYYIENYWTRLNNVAKTREYIRSFRKKRKFYKRSSDTSISGSKTTLFSMFIRFPVMGLWLCKVTFLDNSKQQLSQCYHLDNVLICGCGRKFFEENAVIFDTLNLFTPRRKEHMQGATTSFFLRCPKRDARRLIH